MHAHAFATYTMEYAMKKKTMFETRRGWLAAAGLLCAVVSWGDTVANGPMSEYLAHCYSWVSYSAESCARLADRLATVERPTRAERLALFKARVRLARRAGREADNCAGLAAIAADHPDYAYALYFLSYCVPTVASEPDGQSAVTLLKLAAEIEPDNYLVLARLLFLAEGFPPEAAGLSGRVSDIDPGSLAAYREAMYEAGNARAVWWQAVLKDAEPDDPAAEDLLQATVWEGPLLAGRYIYAAAAREGDLAAAEALRDRLRRDLELDALDYGLESARASLALACQPSLYVDLGLEDVCLSGVEKLAGRASADGLPLPGYVVKVVDLAADHLRRAACAASKGASLAGRLAIYPGECLPEATETAAVRRLRAVLEHHGGAWSSEHHRVHAQGFLGDDKRLEGLRAALWADAGNARARCDLAAALAARGDSAGADALGGVDPECLKRGDFRWGDIPAPP